MATHGAPTPYLDELASLTLFQGLARRELDRIASLCTMIERPAGTVLCATGAAGLEFFVIVDGEVAVSVAGSRVATLGRGSFFGELALLDGEPRSATVTATSAVRLLIFTRRELEEVLAVSPRVARCMLATVGARLRNADARL